MYNSNSLCKVLQAAHPVANRKPNVCNVLTQYPCCVLQAPASLLDALEEHLRSLEGKKGTGTVAPPPKYVLSPCGTVHGWLGSQTDCHDFCMLVKINVNIKNILSKKHCCASM